MLPVRTQGVIFTLRNHSFARMELARDCAGPGWSLPKGTILVGRTSGGEYDRAFVNVISYIDPRDNKLVKLSGDVTYRRASWLLMRPEKTRLPTLLTLSRIAR